MVNQNNTSTGRAAASESKATSAQNLVDAMGINRGSIYATFGSKRELYLRALERYLERDRATLTALLKAGPDLRASLGRLLSSYAERLVADPERKGCFFVNACAELGPGDDLLARRLQAEIDGQQDLLRGAIKAAQARGELSDSSDPDSLASFLVGAIHGLRTVGKVTGDRERLQQMSVMIVKALS